MKPDTKLINSLFVTLLLFTVSFTLQGQVYYADVVPDQYINGNNDPILDINGDGSWDIRFTRIVEYVDPYGYFTTIKIRCGIGVSVAIDSTVTNPDCITPIESGSLIGPDHKWRGGLVILVSSHPYANSQWPSHQGLAYIGVKMNIGNKIHYAWIRFKCNPLIAMDSGFNENENESIVAGMGIPEGATSVYGYDGDDKIDGRDIHYSFTKAYNDSELSRYRLMVAKSNDSLAYDLDYVLDLPQERYIEIFVESISSYVAKGEFNFNTLDIRGDSIELLTDYKIHLLNIASSGLPEDNFFSTCSDDFSLQVIPNMEIQIPLAYDDGNSNTASDIRVEFNMVANEFCVDEYRIYLGNADELENLSVDSLFFFDQIYYTSIEPSGTNIDITLKQKQLTLDGSPPAINEPYAVIVMAVTDSSYSNISSISNPSNSFSILDPNVLRAGQKVGENVTYVVMDTPLIVSYDSYNEGFLDIDQDSIDDLQFIGHRNDWSSSLEIVTLRNNCVLITDDEDYENWAKRLQLNHGIGDVEYEWGNGSIVIWDWSAYYPPYNYGEGFWNEDVSYFGVRLMDKWPPVDAWVKIDNEMNRYLISEMAYQDVLNSIPDNGQVTHTNIFPNPADNLLTIEFSKTYKTNPQALIYNSYGQNFGSLFLYERSNIIDISDFTPGIYFLRIVYSDSRTETHKIIIK